MWTFLLSAENVCHPCKQPLTFESLLDSYCWANFGKHSQLYCQNKPEMCIEAMPFWLGDSQHVWSVWSAIMYSNNNGIQKNNNNKTLCSLKQIIYLTLVYSFTQKYIVMLSTGHFYLQTDTRQMSVVFSCCWNQIQSWNTFFRKTSWKI